MGPTHSTFAGSFFRRALACACVACALGWSCTTTLDPSVVVVGDDGGAETGEPLVPCTTFASPVSEYFVCPGLLAHDAALGDCALRGATLAAIGSAEEDAFVAAGAIPVVSADLWLG
jgi:hypothetical protein